MQRVRASSGTSRILPIACALSMCVAVLSASGVRADERTDARRHFRRGMDLIAQRSYDEGIRELEIAYRTLPHPNVLYNIARAYAELGQYERAISYFREYLQTSPPDYSEVESFIAALEERSASEAAPPPPPTNVTSEPADPEARGPASLTEAELEVLRSSIEQLDRLAEATQSEALRERADRMRAIVANATTLQTQPQGTDEIPSSTEVPATPTDAASGAAESGLQVGAERTGDTYEEQIVSASRYAQSPLEAPNSTTIVTAQDIRLSGVTSIAELLRRAAGVDVMQLAPSDSQVSIRGLNQRMSNKVLVLVNGRSVYLDFLGTVFWRSLPVVMSDIERIEVIRGPASALYGADAFTGIVNIILREPGNGTSAVSFGAGNGDTIDATASITGRSEDFSYRFGGGYQSEDSYALETTSARADAIPFLTDDPSRAYARSFVTGEFRYNFGDGYQAESGVAVSSGDLNFYGIGRLRQLVSKDQFFSQVHANLRTPYGLSLRSFWNHFLSDASTVEVRPGAIPIFSDDIEQNVVDVELDYSENFHALFDHNIVVGAGYRYKSIQYDWIDDDHDEHHIAAYLQDSMQILERLQFVASARIDRHPLLDGVQFSPRGSAVVRVTDGSAVRATVGTAFRSPTFLESYLAFENQTPIRGVEALAVGNTNLDPERMFSAEIGYANQESDYFAVEANGYFNLIDDQILLSRINRFTLSDVDEGRGAYDEERAAFPVGELEFQNENATFRQIGGELGIRLFPLTGLDVFANYAFHRTEPLERYRDELGIRADDQRASEHKLNFGVQYRSPFGLDLAADLQYVTEQLWVEQVTDTVQGVRFEAFGLPAYTVLNARVGYRLFEDKLELAVIGTNLSDPDHREHPFGQPIATRVMGTARIRF